MRPIHKNLKNKYNIVETMKLINYEKLFLIFMIYDQNEKYYTFHQTQHWSELHSFIFKCKHTFELWVRTLRVSLTWSHLIVQLAIDCGIKFLETSAKSSINVEEVSSWETFYFTSQNKSIWLFPFPPQAFLTLGRDIMTRLTRKMVSLFKNAYYFIFTTIRNANDKVRKLFTSRFMLTNF